MSTQQHVTAITNNELLELAAERDRPAELLLWLIDRFGIDLLEMWPDLNDDTKTVLVDCGIVKEVKPTATLTDHETLTTAHSENTTWWPEYTVELTAAHLPEPLEVSGWVECGWWRDYDGDGWRISNGEGGLSGLPHCSDDAWEIGNVEGGNDVEIPLWRSPSGGFLTFDRSVLGRCYINVIDDAADHTDWSEPTIDDIDASDLDDDESVWIVKGGEAAEITLSTGGLGETETEDWYDDENGGHSVLVTTYELQAWTHELADGRVFADRDDALAHLAECHGVEKVYDSEDLLIVDTLDDCCREFGEPEGLTVRAYGRSDDRHAGYIHPHDDHDNNYHVTAEQALSCRREGWGALLPDLVQSLGRRACLDACKEWRDEADARLQRDGHAIMVTWELSIDAGNCEQESNQLRDAIVDSFGDVTAVDARFLLSLRDDQYSRRACRLAAMSD